MSPPETEGVVVTGLGAVTPLGASARTTWEALVAGKSGVARVPELAEADLPVEIAAPVRGELELGDIDRKELRRLDRVVSLALAAARNALSDAGFVAEGVDRTRVGVAIGSGIGGISTILHNHRAFLERGHRRVSPFMVPMGLANLPSSYVAIRYGLRGPNLCTVAACASGAQAIGEAARTIARGDADVMLAGGSEAAIVPLVIAGFHNMQALSTRNDAPDRASRPFDAERDGIVIGEGAGALLLESRSHARARGARVHAELLGYGATADATHIAAPDPEGRGAESCIRRALADAALAPEAIGYVNAHATGTPLGDRVEAQAIRRCLGSGVPVSSTKGATGHLLGAAGAVEAIFAIQALVTGVLPATLNLENPDSTCPLSHVAQSAVSRETRVTMTNAFGFGGTNTCLVFGREEL